MPASLCGTWEMINSVNMEGYMIALGKFLNLIKLTSDITFLLNDLRCLHFNSSDFNCAFRCL